MIRRLQKQEVLDAIHRYNNNSIMRTFVVEKITSCMYRVFHRYEKFIVNFQTKKMTRLPL
jgi:predicted GNAT family acetyltransferase